MKKTIVVASISLSIAICTTSYTLIKSNNDKAKSINKLANVDEVKIGKQVWMSKNLEVTIFGNGETIEEAKNSKEWRKACKEGRSAWCYYMFKEEHGLVYGKIYNWFAVNDPRGLAPKGWHIPTNTEWTTLVDHLGGESVAAPKMKSTSGWGGNTNGTNNIFGTMFNSPVYHYTSGKQRMMAFDDTWNTAGSLGSGGSSTPFGGGLSINLNPATPNNRPATLLTIANGNPNFAGGWRN